MNFSSQQFQVRTIRFGLVLYWFLFWMLNVVDKFIAEPTFLWKGKNRIGQLLDYFASVGIEDPIVAHSTFVVVTILELFAFVFLAVALWNIFKKRDKKTDEFFFLGTLVGMIIFSFFSIGDQVFGDRVELLEHTTYWVALIVSWGAFEFYPKLK